MTSNFGIENNNKSVFYEENHISSWISKAFSDPSLCNVSIITANGEAVPCIDIVLKAGSRVFKEMVENCEGTTVIVINDADPEALKELLVFMHMGECWINSDILAGLMEVGNRYEVSEIINLCERFVLEGHLFLDLRNCCRLYEASLQCGFLDLIRLCRQYIIGNLEYMCENKTFVNLKYETVVELANHEADPFFFAWGLANWAALDLDSRQEQFEALFVHIDLGSLKVEDLACLTSHIAVDSNKVVRDAIINAFKIFGKNLSKDRCLGQRD